MRASEYWHLVPGRYTRAQQHHYLVNFQRTPNSSSRELYTILVITALSNSYYLCTNGIALLRDVVPADVLCSSECGKSRDESEPVEKHCD